MGFWSKHWWTAAMIGLMGSVVLDFGASQALSAADLKALTLDDCIQMALDAAPELREAEQDVLAAQADLSQAKAGQWAQMEVIGLAGPVNDADQPLVTVRQNANGRFRGRLREQDEESIGVFGRLELVLVQPLYTFGKISKRQDAAARGLEVQRIEKEKKRGDVILGVKELYFALVVALQGREAAADADAFIEDAKMRIKRLLSVSSRNVDPTDLHRQEAFTAEVKAFQAKAEAGAQIASLALKKKIGLPTGQEIKLKTSELPRAERDLPPQEEYIQAALERRPEIKQLEEGIEAQQSLVQAAKADLYPSFFGAAIGSFAGAPGRERLDISYLSDDFNHARAGLVVGAEWHLDMGIGRARVRKEEANYRKLLHTREFAEQNIPIEVAKYYQDVRENQASYQAYEEGAVAARRWIVASFTNFDMGVGTAKDMFDAIDRYGKNQGEYLHALYNYHVALARLEHAVAEYRTTNP
jgi:outer membrane protein TolC